MVWVRVEVKMVIRKGLNREKRRSVYEGEEGNREEN